MIINNISDIIDNSNSFVTSIIDEYIRCSSPTFNISSMALDIQETLEEHLLNDGIKIDYNSAQNNETSFFNLDNEVKCWLESRIYSYLTKKGWEVCQCAM